MKDNRIEQGTECGKGRCKKGGYQQNVGGWRADISARLTKMTGLSLNDNAPEMIDWTMGK